MATRIPPSIGAEADQLETAINRARLSIDQEVAVWDMYGDHGLAPAQHVLTAIKEAKSPTLLRQKAAPVGDIVDQAIERLRAAAVTAAQSAGDTQIAEQIDALAARLAPAKGRPMLTDSGEQSVIPVKQKATAPGSGEQLKALISSALDAAARNGGIH